MKLLGILLVLSAFTSKGYSIVCKNCWHFATTPCTEPTVSCPNDQICVAALTMVIEGTKITPQYSVSCGTQSECNVTGSLNFIYGRILTGTSCCSTDNCDPPTPQLPVESSVKNGLTCRTCYSGTSDYCYTGDKIECTGDQNKCGRMARTLTGTFNTKDATRGCTTESFCGILGNKKDSINGLNVDMAMYCSDGATGLYSGLIYFVIVALLTTLLF
ncbi:phospholipase A2 inhibitor and Ly6/PLAUR domain-containing protein-like [Rana temporaria]|uniref:phospholipase A2 inhibitor and Ly6/PLAUR domain-containing protein-like n=1 Tax=Rana temporaria TaxID=8407 RepID=UPI001AADEB8A|nr:phospholipase A2 inhibitor and Ly6/PLAUR domain-containing protein-like [Rana temporaria]